MSPIHKTRAQYSPYDLVMPSQIATFLVRQVRRTIRRAARRPSPNEAVA